MTARQTARQGKRSFKSHLCLPAIGCLEAPEPSGRASRRPISGRKLARIWELTRTWMRTWSRGCSQTAPSRPRLSSIYSLGRKATISSHSSEFATRCWRRPRMWSLPLKTSCSNSKRRTSELAWKRVILTVETSSYITCSSKSERLRRSSRDLRETLLVLHTAIYQRTTHCSPKWNWAWVEVSSWFRQEEATNNF